MKKYEPFAHTADLGLRVWGKSLEELFTNAAEGMFSLITDIEKVMPKKRVAIEMEGLDEVSLLVNYLNELLFQFEAHGMLFSRFKIDEMDTNRVVGWVEGEEYDPGKHGSYLLWAED